MLKTYRLQTPYHYEECVGWQRVVFMSVLSQVLWALTSTIVSRLTQTMTIRPLTTTWRLTLTLVLLSWAATSVSACSASAVARWWPVLRWSLSSRLRRTVVTSAFVVDVARSSPRLPPVDKPLASRAPNPHFRTQSPRRRPTTRFACVDWILHDAFLLFGLPHPQKLFWQTLLPDASIFYLQSHVVSACDVTEHLQALLSSFCFDSNILSSWYVP